MSTEIVIVYSRELLPLRILRAALSCVESGIYVDRINIIVANAPDSEYEYLKSISEFNILDYRTRDRVFAADAFDRFLYEDAQADNILFIHPDAIPVKAGWGKLLLDKCVLNKFACFIHFSDFPDFLDYGFGVYVYTIAMMIDREWFCTNRLTTELYSYPFDESNYPKQYLGLFRIGKIFQAGEVYSNVLLIANDCAYKVLEVALQQGYQPVLNIDMTYNIPHTYFFHIGNGSSFIYSNFDTFKPTVDWHENKKNCFEEILNGEKYKELCLLDKVRQDGCWLTTPDYYMGDYCNGN